ncbi:MAG TPA: hypothetical protein VEI96_05605, partial [Thermodesulfovibrionales bacterium]|nr:hypothetical protein [Thermodesulfovibrionales bacterium]
IKETFEITTRALLKDISKKHRVDILPVKEEGVFVKIREKDSFKIEEVMPASEPVEEPIEIVDAVEDLDAVETVDTLEPIETVNPEDAGAFVDTVAPVDTAVPADTVPSASTTAPMNIAGVMTAAEPMDTRAVDAPKERGSIPESAVSEGPVSPPALPDKELKRIVDSLRELIQSISDTRDTVSNLSQEIRDVASTRSRDMKDVVSAQSHETKDAVSALARELKDTLSVLFSEMNEARKQQTEIVNSLREMRISLAKIKGKRRWFRLW